MLRILKTILEIQELDMKMIRLIRLKKDRHRELDGLTTTRDERKSRREAKSLEIDELKHLVRLSEREAKEIGERISHFESQQDVVKRVEEFNALAQEISQSEREKLHIQQRLTDASERLHTEEEVLGGIESELDAAQERVDATKDEVTLAITRINQEGSSLKRQRAGLADRTDPETLSIYERLLRHHRDRVVVPIENRACSGCHILITAQHENLVRKSEKLVFCEHCSRIHFWQESELATPVTAVKKRRRRVAVS